MPPPTGVVNGPLMPTRNSRNASTVSSGSHSSNLSFAVWPAKTSNQEIFFLPPKAFSTAASNTRSLAAQISGPVPSPRMNGMTGWFGTWRVPLSIEIFSPDGGVTFLYGISDNCSGSCAGCNLAEMAARARETRINRDLHEIGRFQESESTTTAASRTNAVRTLQERSRLLENHAEFGDPQSAAEPAVHEQERRIHNHRLSTAIRKRTAEQRTQRRRTRFEPAWPRRGSRSRWPLQW